MKDILTIIAVGFVVILISIAGWKLKRWVNYKFDYSSQVEETVERMVKKECLVKFKEE
mgnify:CR=1 FL=1